MVACRNNIITNISYLGDGSCILDYFNEASVWPSGNAAIRDESKVQTLLLPQLVTIPVWVGVCAHVITYMSAYTL